MYFGVGHSRAHYFAGIGGFLVFEYRREFVAAETASNLKIEVHR